MRLDCATELRWCAETLMYVLSLDTLVLNAKPCTSYLVMLPENWQCKGWLISHGVADKGQEHDAFTPGYVLLCARSRKHVGGVSCA